MIAALLVVALSRATAQSTDIVQRVAFVLKGIVQTSSGAKTVRVGNKEILAALNASGAYKFGSNATLLFDLSDDQPPTLIVQDGTPGQTTNIDVSALFSISEIGDEVLSRHSNISWQTWQFGFDNGNTNAETGFELWGSTIVRLGSTNTTGVGTFGGPPLVQSNVSGVGRLNGAVTVFSGTISTEAPLLVRIRP